MSDYSPVGETWVFDIGPAQIEHRVISDRAMHVRVLSGEFAGLEEDLAIEVRQVGEGAFLVSWQEASKVTVVHWEDYGRGTFLSFATMPDLSFHRFSGRMWRQA